MPLWWKSGWTSYRRAWESTGSPEHIHSCTGGKKNWLCICERNVAIYKDLQRLRLMPRSAPADTRAWGCGGRDRCTLQRSHKMSGDCCCAAALLLLLRCCCCTGALAGHSALGPGSSLEAPAIIFQASSLLPSAILPPSRAIPFLDEKAWARKWRILSLLMAFPKSLF